MSTCIQKVCYGPRAKVSYQRMVIRPVIQRVETLASLESSMLVSKTNAITICVSSRKIHVLSKSELETETVESHKAWRSLSDQEKKKEAKKSFSL